MDDKIVELRYQETMEAVDIWLKSLKKGSMGR